MNIQEKKHIVQKLLSGTLSEEEKARLSQSPEMEQIWLQQWEQASDRSLEVNPDRCGQIFGNRPVKRIDFGDLIFINGIVWRHLSCLSLL